MRGPDFLIIIIIAAELALRPRPKTTGVVICYPIRASLAMIPHVMINNLRPEKLWYFLTSAMLSLPIVEIPNLQAFQSVIFSNTISRYAKLLRSPIVCKLAIPL